MIEALLKLGLDKPTAALSVSGDIEQLLGYRPENFLDGSVSLWDRIHQHDHDILNKLKSVDPRDNTGVCNLRLRQANGRIRCIKCLYNKVPFGSGGGIQLELRLQDAKSLPRTLDNSVAMPDFRAIMELSEDFLYFKDHNHVFTGASQSLVTLCEPVTHWYELVGLTDYDVFPEPYADIYYNLEKLVFAGVPAVKEIQQILTKDGRPGWVDNRKYPIFDGQGQIIGLYGIARDISDLKRAQSSLESFFQQPMSMNLIAGLSGTIVQVNQKWTQVLGLDLKDLVGRNFFELIHPDDKAATFAEVARLAQGMTAINFRNRYQHKDGSYRLLQWTGNVSVADSCIYAVAEDITERDKLEQELKLYLERIEKSVMQTVEVTTTMCEMRDPYNAGHQKRVAAIAAGIGTEMGMEQSQVNGLRVAGLVHDVGMFMTPTEITLKPGKLSDIEFRLIKGHTLSGHELLKNVDFPWPVATVALQHHERMDGCGYPNGLTGGEIVIEARIIAVADVVAAMVSHRPYRVALSINDALEEVSRGRGSLYDAEVADACLRLFREKDFVIPAI